MICQDCQPAIGKATPENSYRNIWCQQFKYSAYFFIIFIACHNQFSFTHQSQNQIFSNVIKLCFIQKPQILNGTEILKLSKNFSVTLCLRVKIIFVSEAREWITVPNDTLDASNQQLMKMIA